MSTANEVLNYLGPLNVFLGIYLIVIISLAVGAMWAVWQLQLLFKARGLRCVASTAQENEALLGADAIPSVVLSVGHGDCDFAFGTPIHLCPKGGGVEVMENLFHDQECRRPCGGHPTCLLAG